MDELAVDPPTSDAGNSWWSRPSGGRELLRVAAPLVVSSLSWTVMTFVDRIFLNWVSGTAMSAAFSSSMVWFLILCLPLGITMYANTFVAQYFGSGQRGEIGPAVWQSVWIAVGFTPLVLLAIPLAPTIFSFAGHDPATLAIEIEYFQIISWGGPPMLIAQAAASFYSGRGETRVVMWVDAAVAVLNLVLDYLWIFGYAGFPAWGVAGAAWATVLSLWVKALVYVLLPLQRAHRIEFGTHRGLRFDFELVRRMLYFGGPSGLQMVLDLTGFTAFILLVGRLGDVPRDATTMAFSVGSVAFMPIWGLSSAVSILVGQHLGEDRDDLAARVTYTGLHLAWAYMVGISLLYVFAPGIFLHGFVSQATATAAESAAVYALAVTLLRFVAGYNLLDATFMTFVSAIKGAGDTVFVLRVSLVLAALLAGLSYLSVVVWDFGVYGCWLLITGWIWIAAITFYLRFRQGKWRSMRVIERSGEAELAVPAAIAVAE
jgi:MATE family multidrug resistance protein